MGSEPALSQQVVEALLNNETYFFRDRSPFDTLAAPCACPSSRQAPRTSRSGCASGRPAARPGRKSIRWRCCSPNKPEQWRGWTIDILGTDVSSGCVDRARAGTYTPVRGPARPRHQADDQMVRGMRRRLARGRGAAQAGPLPGPQSARAAAASGRIRHRPVPQRPALPQRRKEGAGVRAARARRWPRTAG